MSYSTLMTFHLAAPHTHTHNPLKPVFQVWTIWAVDLLLGFNSKLKTLLLATGSNQMCCRPITHRLN